MKIWVISDTHFGHANIIKYCDRPWCTTAEMDDALIKNWNSVVAPDDLVIHLGDFCFASRERAKEIVSTLNGHIVLIMGNHDRGRKPEKWLEAGMFRVYDRPQIMMNHFLLCHEPSSVDRADIYYMYGHVHNRYDVMGNPHKNKCYCVEQIDYTPKFFGVTFMSPEEFCDTQLHIATFADYKRMTGF